MANAGRGSNLHIAGNPGHLSHSDADDVARQSPPAAFRRSLSGQIFPQRLRQRRQRNGAGGIQGGGRGGRRRRGRSRGRSVVVQSALILTEESKAVESVHGKAGLTHPTQDFRFDIDIAEKSPEQGKECYLALARYAPSFPLFYLFHNSRLLRLFQLFP